MRLLTTGGQTMKWGSKTQREAIPYVHHHGISQFVAIWRANEHIRNKPFLWGEELEHLLMKLVDREYSVNKAKQKGVRISLTAASVLENMRSREKDCSWLPEFGSFMIETTPAAPYDTTRDGLLRCQMNLQKRYQGLAKYFESDAPGERRLCVTLTSFPLMGIDMHKGDGKVAFIADYEEDPNDPGNTKVKGEWGNSLFVPDIVINQTHPRFVNLVRNIRLRRGRKVCIQIPMYIDEHTVARSVDPKFRVDSHSMNSQISCDVTPSDGGPKTAGFSCSMPPPLTGSTSWILPRGANWPWARPRAGTGLAAAAPCPMPPAYRRW